MFYLDLSHKLFHLYFPQVTQKITNLGKPNERRSVSIVKHADSSFCGTLFVLGKRINRKKYAPKPKIMDAKASGIDIYTSSDNAWNWRNASPHTSIKMYWIFNPALSIPNASIFMLKLQINKITPQARRYQKRTF